MKVARNKDKSLLLIPNFGSVQRTENEWKFYPFLSNISNEHMMNPTVIDADMFSNLKWEDEPIDVDLVPSKDAYYHLSYFTKWLEDNRFVEKDFDDENKAVDEAKRMKKLGADNINLSKCYRKQKIEF